jgi:hypothetical protein
VLSAFNQLSILDNWSGVTLNVLFTPAKALSNSIAVFQIAINQFLISLNANNDTIPAQIFEKVFLT